MAVRADDQTRVARIGTPAGTGRRAAAGPEGEPAGRTVIGAVAGTTEGPAVAVETTEGPAVAVETIVDRAPGRAVAKTDGRMLGGSGDLIRRPGGAVARIQCAASVAAIRGAVSRTQAAIGAARAAAKIVVTTEVRAAVRIVARIVARAVGTTGVTTATGNAARSGALTVVRIVATGIRAGTGVAGIVAGPVVRTGISVVRTEVRAVRTGTGAVGLGTGTLDGIPAIGPEIVATPAVAIGGRTGTVARASADPGRGQGPGMTGPRARMGEEPARRAARRVRTIEALAGPPTPGPGTRGTRETVVVGTSVVVEMSGGTRRTPSRRLTPLGWTSRRR